jgi:hypothetical protein
VSVVPEIPTEVLMLRPRIEAARICLEATRAEIAEARRPGGLTTRNGEVAFESRTLADRLEHLANAAGHLSKAVEFVADAMPPEDADQ